MTRSVAALLLAVAVLAGCASEPPREHTVYVSSLLASEVTWVVLVDGEATDRGVVRVGADSEQPFTLPVEQGQRVSFTVGVVGSGLARCRVVRVADGAEVVPLVRQEPQVDRAPESSPPATCEFVA